MIKLWLWALRIRISAVGVIRFEAAATCAITVIDVAHRFA